MLVVERSRYNRLVKHLPEQGSQKVLTLRNVHPVDVSGRARQPNAHDGDCFRVLRQQVAGLLVLSALLKPTTAAMVGDGTPNFAHNLSSHTNAHPYGHNRLNV